MCVKVRSDIVAPKGGQFSQDHCADFIVSTGWGCVCAKDLGTVTHILYGGTWCKVDFEWSKLFSKTITHSTINIQAKWLERFPA
jgi:hypothetical protein